jgi:pimeloyl-ACP methyl ester carboxylesterase
MPPILHHSRVTAPEASPGRWLLILHGIYGSGRNWRGIARRLVEARPEWGVILPDLRLHGGSTGFDPPHTLQAAAADVAALLDDLGTPAQAVLGHSFGGKVAIVYARGRPGNVAQVWVVDSTLEVREPSGSAWDLVGTVGALPERFPSRDSLVGALAPYGYSAPLAHWLGMNLERDGDSFRWRLDWKGMEEMLRDYFQTDVWRAIEAPPEGTEIHVIRASGSESLSDGDSARIERAGAGNGSTFLHVVDGGHWINLDNPDEIVALVARTLP